MDVKAAKLFLETNPGEFFSLKTAFLAETPLISILSDLNMILA